MRGKRSSKEVLRAISWDEETYRTLLKGDACCNMTGGIPDIGKNSILKFRLDGANRFAGRPSQQGNLLVFRMYWR